MSYYKTRSPVPGGSGRDGSLRWSPRSRRPSGRWWHHPARAPARRSGRVSRSSRPSSPKRTPGPMRARRGRTRPRAPSRPPARRPPARIPRRPQPLPPPWPGFGTRAPPACPGKPCDTAKPSEDGRARDLPCARRPRPPSGRPQPPAAAAGRPATVTATATVRRPWLAGRRAAAAGGADYSIAVRATQLPNHWVR